MVTFVEDEYVVESGPALTNHYLALTKAQLTPTYP